MFVNTTLPNTRSSVSLFYKSVPSILFLSWESPWPAHTGAALRTLGLITELAKYYNIELLLLTKAELSAAQYSFLTQLVGKVHRIPLVNTSMKGQITTLATMFRLQHTYHCSALWNSLRRFPEVERYIFEFQGVTLTSHGNWGALVNNRLAPNWILNQCDADVDFWRVYATNSSQLTVRVAAKLNYLLARKQYPKIYSNVSRVVSVCEEDKRLTLKLAPQAKVDVIENGVDCQYLTPDHRAIQQPIRLLFTGTSAPRNVVALQQFANDIWPLIRKQLPTVEVLVAGNFDLKTQKQFMRYENFKFTGRVDDIRPFFNRSHIFIAPFRETHGSKIKIAEAMAMAMPIVATSQGVRGFPLVHNESVLIADSHEQFAAHVITLARDSSLREYLGASAREVALKTISWSVLIKKLTSIIDSTYENLR
jgi:glycosyltransferase involved in cell wall biosynthesis